MNRKLVPRLHHEAGLTVRRRKRRRIGLVEWQPLSKPIALNISSSMDFGADGLADERRLRRPTIVDDCTLECLAIEVDTSLTGRRVVAVLDRLLAGRGAPASITVDHGPEFEDQALDAWAYQHDIRLAFIRPCKPVENAYIESFNCKFHDECLNEHWFVTMDHAWRLAQTAEQRLSLVADSTWEPDQNGRQVIPSQAVCMAPSSYGDRSVDYETLVDEVLSLVSGLELDAAAGILDEVFKLHGKDKPQLVYAQDRMARLQHRCRDWPELIGLNTTLEDALLVAKDGDGRPYVNATWVLLHLANLKLFLGRYRDSIPLFEELMKIETTYWMLPIDPESSWGAGLVECYKRVGDPIRAGHILDLYMAETERLGRDAISRRQREHAREGRQ